MCTRVHFSQRNDNHELLTICPFGEMIESCDIYVASQACGECEYNILTNFRDKIVECELIIEG